jgi:hypothetical protein
MNWFKRLCLFVFGLSGLLSLAALSLVWVGPWTTQARSLITETRWYFIALEVLVCLSAVGLLACVLVSLFAPRNPKALKIDFEKRPPYFEVSPTHKARTWLLDPRAPKIDPPEAVVKLATEGVKGYE